MAGILEKKKRDTVKFKAEIGKDVADKLLELEERIKVEAPSSHLNTDLIVEKALLSAIRKANKELDSITITYL